MEPNRLLVELLVLVSAVALPAVIYVGGLGFYSDDWHFLSLLSTTRGLQEALSALASDMLSRPPQLLLTSLEYEWFQLSPLGYQFVSISLLACTMVGLYVSLLELELPRYLAFGTAALYATLPHYSTDRFWVAAQQADIAAAFFFLGTYSVLRAVRPSARWPVWLAAGAIGVAVSLLAYEVFVGMAAFVLPAAVLVRARQTRIARARIALIVGIVLVVVVGVVVYKIATTSRLPEFPNTFVRLRWFAAVLRDGVAVSYAKLGIGLPVAAATAFVRRPDAWSGLVALCVGLLIAVVSYRVSSIEPSRSRPLPWLSFTVAGLFAFVAGLAIFISSTAFAGTAAGPGNRIMIASAAGVALTLTVVAGWLTARIQRARARAAAFSSFVGAFAACGILINVTVAEYWVAAARQQSVVLGAIATVAPSLPADATLLLARSCPYSGPGIVFEAPWDLTGALRITLRRPDLRADVATPTTEASDAGVTTQIYGVPSFYPYHSLFAFDAPSGTLVAISDRASLEALVHGADPAELESCLRVQPGIGEVIF
jgi:hypothetical protein